MSSFNGKLVPASALESWEEQKFRDEEQKELLTKRQLPDDAWSDDQIEGFVKGLSALDNNNVDNKIVIGEREGQFACKLVERRHYSFAQGIGTRNELLGTQPEAKGSSTLNSLTNALLLDLMRTMGLKSCQGCILLPMSIGMTLKLCLMALKTFRPKANVVLFSHYDHQLCSEIIKGTGLDYKIIRPKLEEGALSTNTNAIKAYIKTSKDKILCVVTTTSCLAPQNADNVFKVGVYAEIYGIPQIVNNAYGMQSLSLMEHLEIAGSDGVIMFVVQSINESLMVPVGGAIVAAFQEYMIPSVSNFCQGPFPSSQSLDVLMTLLSLGKTGYLRLVKEREESFECLRENLLDFANSKRWKIELADCKNNPISLALNLNDVPENIVSLLESKVCTSGVFGARIVTSVQKIYVYSFGRYDMKDYVHGFKYQPHLIVSTYLGTNRKDINKFMQKFEEFWRVVENMQELNKEMDN